MEIIIWIKRCVTPYYLKSTDAILLLWPHYVI